MQVLQRNFTIGIYFNHYRRVSCVQHPRRWTTYTVLQLKIYRVVNFSITVVSAPRKVG